MSNGKITEGKVVLARPAQQLYQTLSNLDKAIEQIPADSFNQPEIRATPDTLIAKLQGIELGITIVERQEGQRVLYSQSENSLFKYSIEVELQQLESGSTELSYKVVDSIPFFIRAVLEKRVKSAMESLGDKLKSGV